MPTVRIDRRFCGPPDSGNGGYVCGLLAKTHGGSDVEVTLHHPPPLDRELRIDGAKLLDGEMVIASASPAAVEIEAPPAPSLTVAEEASKRFTGFWGHIFPTCFVCGPDRGEGDGLRIFAGRLDGGSDQVAALWEPDSSLADNEGCLRPEFVWAALDCPGYFAVEALARPAVLGRLAVRQVEPRIERQPLIVTGWPDGSEGRKHRAGTALHNADGRLLAVGQATWITINA